MRLCGKCWYGFPAQDHTIPTSSSLWPLAFLTILAACGSAAESDRAVVVDTAGSPDPGGPPIDRPTVEAAEAEPEAGPMVPVPFMGRWARGLEDCGGGQGLDRIVIGASEIQFPDGNGRPLSVLQVDANTLLIDLLLVARQGERRERRDRLTIDPDGNSMVYARGGDERRYDRCPI